MAWPPAGQAFPTRRSSPPDRPLGAGRLPGRGGTPPTGAGSDASKG
jgi:hypothetical protein